MKKPPTIRQAACSVGLNGGSEVFLRGFWDLSI